MRSLLSASLLLLVGCGQTQFNTHDPYADAGTLDAGAVGGGGGTATGGGGGGGTATGGGSATGGGGGGGATGGGGGTNCSAANCTGCCANGACQTGTASAQCGRGGVACLTCPPSDVCQLDQTCGIDPASTWEVLPVSAVIAPDNLGFAWDTLSDPDTQLGLWCPSSEADVSVVLPTVFDDFTPTWTSGGCLVTAGELLTDGLGFAANERDTLGDEEIAPFTLAPLSAADLRAGTKTVGPSGGLEALRLRFTKQ